MGSEPKDAPTLPHLVSDVHEARSHAAPRGELDRYILSECLGDGGMGVVYRAYDPSLGRNVAVKVIRAERMDAVVRDRFMAESRVAAQLEHPNIVPIYDVGKTADGTPFLVMKEIRGQSLRDVLDATAEGDPETIAQWSRHRMLTAFLKVCQAMAYAHRSGVLHRDLKPSNIMLGEYGEVLVLDWGVACRLSDPRPRQDGVVGTPGYISPEQVLEREQAYDPRSDVWSLGAILYEILALEPPYAGTDVVDLMNRTVEERPMPPRLRAPSADVPEELEELCASALEPRPADRPVDAAAMAEAVEAYLEGTRRYAEATRHVEQARKVWDEYERMGVEHGELLATEKRHADAADAWAPLSEKRELLETRSALEALASRQAKVFGEVVGLCEKALAHAPDHRDARAALARAYWSRVKVAEERRDAAAVAYYTDRVASYDDGALARLLEGTGSLTIDTDPPGAEVFCERFVSNGLLLEPRERASLGHTPLTGVPLPMGSYLLTLCHPGRRDTRYPVHITRCRHWEAGRVALLTDEAIGDRFLYVPGGPTLVGGDPEAPGSRDPVDKQLPGFLISRFQVSMEEYVAFLNALHERDPAAAWRACPRSEAGLSSSDSQYFLRPKADGRYELPETDDDGNPWEPRWPVFGVSWRDAVAYAAWRSERDGCTYRLPLEDEVEKAARGVDGRFYPWGDGFDRTLCKMGDSRRGRARPEPIGAFPTDVSVYGVRDLAGSMRDWCGDEEFDGDATLRPVRGGSWNYDPRFCRAACRLGRPPWRVFAYNGFRLAKSVT
jgi:serine/threonine-protein kinase